MAPRAPMIRFRIGQLVARYPMLSIEEQKVLGRERYSYIEDDKLAPRTFVDRPGVNGR